MTLAEESYCHRRRGFRSGCCAATAKLWHPGRCPHSVPVSPTSCPSIPTVDFELFLFKHFILIGSRLWCWRQGIGLEVGSGMIPLWVSLLGEELKSSTAV